MNVRTMALTFCFALKCVFFFVLGVYRRRKKSEERKGRGREEKILARGGKRSLRKGHRYLSCSTVQPVPL